MAPVLARSDQALVLHVKLQTMCSRTLLNSILMILLIKQSLATNEKMHSSTKSSYKQTSFHRHVYSVTSTIFAGLLLNIPATEKSVSHVRIGKETYTCCHTARMIVVKLALSSSHAILTPGLPVRELTVYHQTSGAEALKAFHQTSGREALTTSHQTSGRETLTVYHQTW